MAISAFSTNQVCSFRYLPNLTLEQMPRGEEELPHLSKINLRQEVCLVFYRIWCGREEKMIPHKRCRGIVPRGNKIKVLPPLLFEAAELDELIAHHIWVGGQPCSNRIDRVLHDTRPILIM